MSDTEQKAAEKLYKEHGMSLTRVGDGRQRPQQRPEVRSAPDGVVRASGAR